MTELEARDHALDTTINSRATLIAVAKAYALGIANANGSVTSVEVVALMRHNGWGPELDAHDRRWLGNVFRSGEGWRRMGWRNGGSHGRPIAVWARR